jgi:MFS family permease
MALQIPSNVCFIYLGGPLMLGLIAVCWGIVAASMAAVSSTPAFLTVRFLLGIAEAGTVPGEQQHAAAAAAAAVVIARWRDQVQHQR